MLKYGVLSLSGLLGFSLMTFIYFNAMDFENNHEIVLTKLATLRQNEISLEKDVLRARNFWVQNYDSLVSNSEKMKEHCASSPQDFALEPELQKAALRYCRYIDEKLEQIELFKSRNAIIRNSLLYIHKNAIEETASANSSLLQTAMAFYLVPSSGAEKKLRNFIESRSGPPAIKQHARLILLNKPLLDELVHSIVPESDNEEFGLMKQAYFTAYARHSQDVSFYIQLLVSSSVLFLALILYGFIKIWKLGHQLREANQTLERRVEERTADLQQSQQIILEQQQALVFSAKMSALGEMAGGVAHEINNPLAVIALRSEQIEECLHDEKVDREQLLVFLAAIRKTTDRIAKIVKGLKFFSRDHAKNPFEPTPVTVILEDTLEFCREKFRNNNIALTLQPVPEDLTIDCRAVEVSQVVLNLLNNSYDAIQPLKNKWIDLTVKEQGDRILIQVTDSGSGIPPAIQEKLMQPFFTTKEVGKGTGLGLSISRGIIQSHEGQLYIDNECPNTRFCISLPRYRITQNATVGIA